MSQQKEELVPEMLAGKPAFSIEHASAYMEVTTPTLNKWLKQYGIQKYQGKGVKRYVYKEDLDRLKAEVEKPRPVGE